MHLKIPGLPCRQKIQHSIIQQIHARLREPIQLPIRFTGALPLRMGRSIDNTPYSKNGYMMLVNDTVSRSS